MTPLSKITTTPLLAQRKGKKWFPIEKIVLKEMTSSRWLWMKPRTLGVADSLQTLVSLSRHERLIPQGRGRFFIAQTARRPKKVF